MKWLSIKNYIACILILISRSIIFLSLWCPISVYSINQNPLIAQNIVEGIDDLYDPLDDLCLNSDINLMPKRSPAQDIINLLLAVNAIDILSEDLFLRTNPLNSRSLLDLPIFELHSCCLPTKCQPCAYPYDWIAGCHLFFNKTNRSNFTRDSTNLSSYLALDLPTLIEKIETTINHFKDLFSMQEIDVAKIFGLFKNMTVEERRAGFMFHLLHRWCDCEARFMIPFYYLERNFFLRENEVKAIEREFGAGDKEQQEQFQKQHLISDKIGFGDCRIEITKRVYERPMYLIRLGAYTTIPSAVAVHKGIMGSSFARPATLPLLDLEALFNLAQNATPDAQAIAFNTIKNYLLNALDRLSANLLDAPLGNNGHITIGGVARTEALLCFFLPWQWTENVRMQSRLSLEYLFPHFESRFYIERNSFAEFEQRNLNNTQNADENLLFIEQELSKKFYMLALDTRIQPGPIFRWSTYGCYRGSCWDFSLGSDMWLQFKESRHRINTFKKTKARIDTQASKPPFAYQSKIFGGIGYRFQGCNFEIVPSLNLDYTYANSGIGQDYTASINIEALF